MEAPADPTSAASSQVALAGCWSSRGPTTPKDPTGLLMATLPSTPITPPSKPHRSPPRTTPIIGSASTGSTPEGKSHCVGEGKCITSASGPKTHANEFGSSSTTPRSPNSPPAKSSTNTSSTPTAAIGPTLSNPQGVGQGELSNNSQYQRCPETSQRGG